MKKNLLSLVLLSSTLSLISCHKNDIPNEKDKNTNIETPVENNSALVIENNILKGITDKNITSLILPSEIKEIANNVFEGRNITEITLNEGIETIGDACFLNSKIKKINFPSTLKHIGKAAFYECEKLQKISLPKSLKSIGDQGLRTNHDVQTIIFNSSDIPEMHNIHETTVPNILPFVKNINEILVPQQSVEEYKNRLSSYANKIKGI